MPTTEPRHSLPPKRILIAEDEPSVAGTLRLVLAADGYSIEIASDGKEALAIFDGYKPDLVITDFMMANMDGLELAEAIKKRSPAIPIIMLTAYSEGIEANGGAGPNIDLLLSKPFSLPDLRGALQRIFATP